MYVVVESTVCLEKLIIHCDLLLPRCGSCLAVSLGCQESSLRALRRGIMEKFGPSDSTAMRETHIPLLESTGYNHV